MQNLSAEPANKTKVLNELEHSTDEQTHDLILRHKWEPLVKHFEPKLPEPIKKHMFLMEPMQQNQKNIIIWRRTVIVFAISFSVGQLVFV